MHTMSIPDFVRNGWQEDWMIDRVIAHCKRHRIKYQVVGFTLILFVGLADVSQAHEAVATFAQSGTGIDQAGKKLYQQLLSIGRWVIIFKGAIDTIKSVADGDFDKAKTRFLGYVITYVLLLGLPWAFDQIDKLAKETASP